MALIAIYDSGVGGLSIYQHVVKRCPEHDYLFISDNQAFPYGTKTEDELLNRVEAVVGRLNEQFAPAVLIVACNTASTIVLPQLRRVFDFHVIGVVPAIKPAAELSITKSIGLLATPATIDRPYTKELISKFAGDCELTFIGSSELVALAEDKLYQRMVDKVTIGTILKPILSNTNIDVVVLACTHFPLLRSEIGSVFSLNDRELTLLDSGEAIACRLESIIETHSLSVSAQLRRYAIFTEANKDADFAENLERLGFQETMHLVV